MLLVTLNFYLQIDRETGKVDDKRVFERLKTCQIKSGGIQCHVLSRVGVSKGEGRFVHLSDTERKEDNWRGLDVIQTPPNT